MNASDLEKTPYFTTDGKDMWVRVCYYMSPSCTMRNVQTGQVENFGMNGLTAERFHPVILPNPNNKVAS